MRKNQLSEISNTSIRRDKSPIFQVNLMKQKENQQKHPQTSRTSLNLVKVLENNRSDVINLWEPVEDSKQSIQPPHQESQNKFEGYFHKHQKQQQLQHQSSRILNTTRSSKSVQQSIRQSRAQSIFEQSKLDSSVMSNAYESNSPSPVKSQMHQHLLDMNELVCPVHMNRDTQQPRRIRYLCCGDCKMQLICNECQLKHDECHHKSIVKLSEFIEQPILMFIQGQQQICNDISNELTCQLVLQQTQLYNKVKSQALNSKEILHSYLGHLQQSVIERIQQIERQFIYNIDNQLKSIRQNVDQLQEVCFIYKDDFERRQCNVGQSLNEIISEFRKSNDNPYETINELVRVLQLNLNKIPQLNQVVLEQQYDISLADLAYEKLITSNQLV